MKKLSTAILAAVPLLVACASDPKNIRAQYVSPMQYEDYNCKQVSMEMQRVSRRTSELHGNLDQKAGRDSAQTAAGIILFWPALFFLEGGDGPEAQEYARLKGEFDTLESVAIQKKCGFKIERPALEKASHEIEEKPAYPSSRRN